MLKLRSATRNLVNLAAFLGFAIAAAEGRAAPLFFGLGDLPGGEFSSYPAGVSGDGSVVVGYSISGAGHVAARWTLATGMVDLGDPPGPSSAYDVSADGSVIVGYASPGTSYEAFRWASDGGAIGGLVGSVAQAVSADGLVVVGSIGTFRPFRWTSASGLVGLEDPNGVLVTSGAAYDVSSDGAVVVGVSGAEAFRWTAGEGAQGLGGLAAEIRSGAQGVSSDGSVVVGRTTSEDSGSSGSEAFRWTAGGGMVGLGDVPGGYRYSDASDVSADGSVVVGSSYDGDGNYAPFLWDSTYGMRDLEMVLTNLGLGPELDGWDLEAATAISADGLTIVGYGRNPDGASEAWLAQIPEPSTGWLLALGLAALAAARSAHYPNGYR